MRFALSDDQVAFRDAVRDLLAKECTPAVVRAAWDTPAGRLDRGVWDSLDAMGVLSLLVAETDGGLGLDETYLVPILEECGRVALPHPIVETAMVAAPLLGAGAGMVTTDLGGPLLPCAADADVLLLSQGGALALVPSSAAELEGVETVDAARRAARVLRPSAPPVAVWPSQVGDGAVTETPVGTVDGGRRAARSPAAGSRDGTTKQDRLGKGSPPPGHADATTERDPLEKGSSSPGHVGATTAELVTADPAAIELALDRGALGTAAVLVGLGQAMLDLTVGYVQERHQFGQPIGSFQAVKHHLADAALALEFARPTVWQAAWSVARDTPTRGRDVSMAKAMAADATALVGRKALQCHGAIGYTVEADLHLYLKRAWALARAWGDTAHHTDRVALALGA